jgi:lysyl-tRNA synthetase class 2
MADVQNEDFEQLAIRKGKRATILEQGSQAYPVTLPITTTIKDVRETWVELDEKGAEIIGGDGVGQEKYEGKPVLKLALGEETPEVVGLAGRVVFFRDAGKLVFVTLQDGLGRRLQAMFNAAELKAHIGVQEEDKVNGAGVPLEDGGQSLKLLKRTVDLGDHLFVEGHVSSSKRGELSIIVGDWQLASKALRPLPVLHKELNEESRVRRRYVDLIARQEARDMVRTRAAVVRSLRKNFDERDFLELETPMLQTIHGGAAARPFVTHMNAFDIDLYMRIAPELFLKRAVVGGVDKVFEINRNFRNEGADRSHSPEFAMLEAYEAYGNYDTIGELTKNLIQRAALDVFGTLEVKLSPYSHPDVISGAKQADEVEPEVYSFADENWTTMTMYGSLSETLAKSGSKIADVTPETSVEDLLVLAKEAGIEKDVLGKDENGKPLSPPTHGKLVELLWEHYIGDHLYQPTFVRDFPVETSPLVRNHRTEIGVVEKWDLYVRGFELATGYSELVDPVIQRERLVEQSKAAAAGDDEAMPLDEDFLEALEYGMPPTGGMGMGLDRLLMALTGLGIRETVTFPLIKNTAS